MGRQLAYCTNVHAGSDLVGLTDNLSRYSLAVKQHVSPDHPMGVGLWIAAPAVERLRDPAALADLAAWLADHSLVPFTLNGFPYGNFHERVVKHRVYHPTWFEPERLQYTLDLINLLDALLPGSLQGSISTLPIAWREPAPSDTQLQAARHHLRTVAQRLAQLEADTGRLIYLCLEPEPGCYLQCGRDIQQFFRGFLSDDREADQLRRYLRVCHDVCHAAVMFEDQAEVLAQYAQQGIQVGKVQISSAVEANFQQADRQRREQLINQLASFVEERYLHQTAMQLSEGDPLVFFDDLGEAIAAARQHPEYLRGTWRVHFHVPIYLERFGVIDTTQRHVRCCLEAAGRHDELVHFEVETYAWSVLPDPLRHEQLADGIAQEMRWVVQQPQWHTR